MTDLHLIIPPEELVDKWVDEYNRAKVKHHNLVIYIAGKASKWSADAELEACCEWLGGYTSDRMAIYFLRDARRPKPLSEADLALDALGPEPLPENTPSGYTFLNGGAIEGHRRIRRALERLKKLEESTND